MHTTLELISLAKQRLAEKHGLKLPMTDYRFEKLTGFQQSTISRWTRGKNTIGTEFAAQFADLTGLDRAYVLACLEHERSADPTVRQILTDIAKAFSGKAAAAVMVSVLMFSGLSFAPGKAEAATLTTQQASSEQCILRQIRRRRRRERLGRIFRWCTWFPAALALAGCATAPGAVTRCMDEHDAVLSITQKQVLASECLNWRVPGRVLRAAR